MQLPAGVNMPHQKVKTKLNIKHCLLIFCAPVDLLYCRELREHIEPEIHELVRQQRLAQLVEGQFFAHFSTKGRRKGNNIYGLMGFISGFMRFNM